MPDEPKYRKRQEEISTEVTKFPVCKYTELSCSCQELNPIHSSVSLVSIWWFFTPPCEILSNQENFIHSPKSIRNTIIVPNVNIFIGLKAFPPPPPRVYSAIHKCSNSNESYRFLFFGKFSLNLNSKILTPGVKKAH